MAILLIGTLDTKGVEFEYVRDCLVEAGQRCMVIDAGVLGKPTFPPEVAAEKVYAAAGTSLETIRRTHDRGQAIAAAVRGVVKIVLDCHERGEVSGVLGLGGSAGTTIATAAMRALPFGVPKLMVSTLASGQVRPYVGVRDILMMHSVVDICGLNRISRRVLANAAHAMAGMVKRSNDQTSEVTRSEDKPLVAATMFGVTTPCVESAPEWSSRLATRCWSSTPPVPAA